MKKLIPLLLLSVLFIAGCYPGGPITITGQQPVINSFNASPSSISAGQSSTLEWTVSGATTVSIDQGIGNVALTGSRAVAPSTTTTYTLTATNTAGSIPATALVLVSGASYGGPPVINYFTATPQVISGGSNSTFLRWNVSDATSVSIDNGIGPVGSSGTMLVTLSYSTNFTLTATNVYGTVYLALPVTLSGAPPPLSFAVTSVTASTSPPSHTGSCPFQFTFSAIITVNGPGTVTYKWERDDNASAPIESVTFLSAGSQIVTTTWDLGGTGSGWERVHILSPNNTVSNEAIYILNCL